MCKFHQDMKQRMLMVILASPYKEAFIDWAARYYFWLKFLKSFSFLWSSVAVITLSSINGGFLSNLLFEVEWNISILIMSLFSIQITCDIHFSHCCCWKSSSDVVSVIWYSSFWFCNASTQGSRNDGLHWGLHASLAQSHF